MKERALKLYRPPFRFERGYIFDDEGQMVADDAGESVTRVRGWGRIGKITNAEELQDTVGEMIAEAMTEYWQSRLSP